MKKSRREFLETALGAPLVAGIGARGLLARPRESFLAVLAPPAGQGQFENPHLIRYDASCFTINDQDAFIFSGALHYPRCPRALWHDRLLKFRGAGLNTVETYVFWNYHEAEEGRASLDEFEDFVRLVKEMGFWMIVRPGPYVCAEWDAGGFPHWVIAKQFPLRSNHPESIKTSQHWYDLVLPIIQRYQVTMGGPIIMMQVENEYDYWDLPYADKLAYVRALAQMAWNAGITVPLITCWTRPSRQNQDPDMARIMDTCNFYPRWNIVKQVIPELEKLRREEPSSPVGVTELQGGWFSQFGGKLSADQPGVNGAQINMLTKTVYEQGATYTSYYMGFGGTNFDWAARSLTTTYDYAAPVSEPGGLGEKFYATRGIGASLNLFGSVLTRARLPEASNKLLVQSTNPNVSVTERWNPPGGVLFVRENSNAEQRFKMSFPDPASPTHRLINVPREGELGIGPREMKMLPVGIMIPGSQLRYTTAEVLAAGLIVDRQYLIVYDEPGRVAEVSLATQNEPQVEGDTVYRYWDPEYESFVLGVRVEKTERILLVNNHLLLVVLPRERALRTWTVELPASSLVGADQKKHMLVPFLSDAALLAGFGSHKNIIWADLDFTPGEHDLNMLLPSQPTKCRIDGTLVDSQYERPHRATRVHVSTPPRPAQSMTLNEIETWVEKFDRGAGEWLTTPARALEDLGGFASWPYHYVKYRADFDYAGQAKMFISTFTADGKAVFVNGKPVPEASVAKKQVEIAVASCAKPGTNTLEIAYELFGTSNGGKEMGELHGVRSAGLGADANTATPILSWQVQRHPAAMRARSIDPEYPAGGWTQASLSPPTSPPSPELVPAFTWCRAGFALDETPHEWSTPWKLTFEAGRGALLYLNGKFVGRYVTIGPQRDFYLPEPYLNFGSKQRNILTVVLAYSDNPSPIRTLRVGPYEEFSTRRTRIEFEF